MKSPACEPDAPKSAEHRWCKSNATQGADPRTEQRNLAKHGRPVFLLLCLRLLARFRCSVLPFPLSLLPFWVYVSRFQVSPGVMMSETEYVSEFDSLGAVKKRNLHGKRRLANCRSRPHSYSLFLCPTLFSQCPSLCRSLSVSSSVTFLVPVHFTVHFSFRVRDVWPFVSRGTSEK